MQFTFRPIDRNAAGRIVAWRYDPPYDFYNMDASALPELLAPTNAYYVASSGSEDDLVGFCCFGPDARVPGGDYTNTTALDVGIGLRPDLTGRGLGAAFLGAVLTFGERELGATRFRATIAAFNTRSIRVAERADFVRTSTFMSANDVEFVQIDQSPDDRAIPGNSGPAATSFELLLRRLQLLCAKRGAAMIAIGGFGGSGKSTLANRLVDEIDASIVQTDDFYVPDLGHADLGRLRSEVLHPLSLGRTARFRRFDWTTSRLAAYREIPPGGPVIVEGGMVLSPQLLPYYDFTIWVDCPQEVAFQRGVTRDQEQYGVDTRQRWLDLWIPLEKSYVDTQRPVELADFVFNTADG